MRSFIDQRYKITKMTRDYKNIRVDAEATGFGAGITNLDLSKPLPAVVLAEVRQAWTDHSVVYFPDQPLSHAALEAFTQQIGPFGVDPYVEAMDGHPHILEVRREADEKAPNFGAGWHSDWSFQEQPPSATILHAKVTPPVGGDTHYCDCYRAYETLSPVMRDILDGLDTLHSATRPYGSRGFFAKETAARAMKIISSHEADARQKQPLVRVHPASGRRSLFINPNYTICIDGMTEDESEAVLGYLYKHMLQDRFIYKHTWQPNMLIMWDNRCVLHSAQGGYDGHQRIMHRTVVAGERPVAVSEAA